MGHLEPWVTPSYRYCVRDLLGAGIETARSAGCNLGGERLRLSCVPCGGSVVTTLTPFSTQTPCDPCSVHLTAREREVIRALADRDTSSHAPRCRCQPGCPSARGAASIGANSQRKPSQAAAQSAPAASISTAA